MPERQIGSWYTAPPGYSKHSWWHVEDIWRQTHCTHLREILLWNLWSCSLEQCVCRSPGKTCWSNECWTICSPTHGVLVCWSAVSLNCIWGHFQGIYRGCQQWDRCVCVCLQSISLKAVRLWVICVLGRWWQGARNTHMQTQTHTLCCFYWKTKENPQSGGEFYIFTSHRQTFHSPF